MWAETLGLHVSCMHKGEEAEKVYFHKMGIRAALKPISGGRKHLCPFKMLPLVCNPILSQL